MAGQYLYSKTMAPFGGVDFASPKHAIKPGRGSDSKNVMIGRNGEKTKRPGTQIIWSGLPTLKTSVQPDNTTDTLSMIQSANSNHCAGLFSFKNNVVNATRATDNLIAALGSFVTASTSSLGGINFYSLVDAYCQFTTTGDSQTFEVDPSTNTFKFKISLGSNLIYSFDAGTGLEATPKTLTDFTTAAAAFLTISGNFLDRFNTVYYSVAGAGTGTAISPNPFPPGSFSFFAPFKSSLSSPSAMYTPYFSLIPNGTDNQNSVAGLAAPGPFFQRLLSRSTYGNHTYFTQLSSAAVGSNIYFAGKGSTSLGSRVIKFDGRRAYPAGLPDLSTTAIQTVIATGAGAVFTAGDIYRYAWTLSYTDASGVTIESNLSPILTYTIPAGGKGSISLSSGASSADLAYPEAHVLTGTGTTSTATAQGPYAPFYSFIFPNDVLYMSDFDNRQNIISRKVVTYTDPDTVTFNPAVKFAAPATLATLKASFGMFASLYRSTANGQDLYLVARSPVGTPDLNTAGSFTDILPDSGLGPKYVFPLKSHNPPINFNIICEHQGLIIGIDYNTNKLYFSSEEHPEYFPPLNTVTLPLKIKEHLTGLKSYNNVLYVFTEFQIFVINGNLNTDFTVRLLSSRTGCVAHNTIQEIGGVMYFLGSDDIYKITDGSLPVSAGSLISDIFKSPINNEVANFKKTEFVFNKACAAYLHKFDKYVLSLPAYDVNIIGNTGTTTAAQLNTAVPNPTYSIVFCLDIPSGEIDIWRDLPITSMVSYDDNIFMSVLNDSTNNGTSQIRKFLIDDNNYQSYADHISPINAYWKSHWESLGEPGVNKNFNRLMLYSMDNRLNKDFSLSFTIERDYGYSSRTASFTVNFPFSNTINPAIPREWMKLDQNKCKALRLTLSNGNLYENISISGYEMMVSTDYDQLDNK